MRAHQDLRHHFGIKDGAAATNDLDRLKSLGYNCVRVPFFYHLLEDELHPYVYKTSGWALKLRAAFDRGAA